MDRHCSEGTLSNGTVPSGDPYPQDQRTRPGLKLSHPLNDHTNSTRADTPLEFDYRYRVPALFGQLDYDLSDDVSIATSIVQVNTALS